MSNIIIKQYNGSSYFELIPKDSVNSINSDTVDNYHASELIQTAYNQSMEYTDLRVAQLQDGTSYKLRAITTFTCSYNSTMRRYAPNAVGEGWNATIDLSLLNDKKLIALSPYNTLSSSVWGTAAAPTGTFTVNLNGSEKTLADEGYGFSFAFPKIDLLQLFNKVVNKTDTLFISFKVTSSATKRQNRNYLSSATRSETTEGNFGLIIK